MFSCKFCEMFKNTYFVEHLRAAVSEESDQVIIVWEDDTGDKLSKIFIGLTG